MYIYVYICFIPFSMLYCGKSPRIFETKPSDNTTSAAMMLSVRMIISIKCARLPFGSRVQHHLCSDREKEIATGCMGSILDGNEETYCPESSSSIPVA